MIETNHKNQRNKSNVENSFIFKSILKIPLLILIFTNLKIFIIFKTNLGELMFIKITNQQPTQPTINWGFMV